MTWWEAPLLIVIGLASGLTVGSGLVALLSVLDIIPRLAQVTRTFRNAHVYEGAVVAGAVFWSVLDMFGWSFRFSLVLLAAYGIFAGVFVGMLAAALTEVLNVFPILAKRLRMKRYMTWLLVAVVLGKIAGSLFDWLLFFP